MFEVEMTAAGPFSTIEQKLVFRSPNAVLFVSPEWRIVYANRLAVQIAQVGEWVRYVSAADQRCHHRRISFCNASSPTLVSRYACNFVTPNARL